MRPCASCADSHLGGMPRPAQVSDGLALLRYLGSTFMPFWPEGLAGAFLAAADTPAFSRTMRAVPNSSSTL